MLLLVVGAAGRTGRAVVRRAVQQGHEVTALVHREPAGPPVAAGVTVVVGDARDPDVLDAAVAGQDAVIDTVGGRTPYRRTSLEVSVARALVTAMRRHGVRRLVVTSSLGVGESTGHAPLLVRLMVATTLRGSTRDKTALEAVVRSSGLDWVITRPAVLTDDRPAGQVRLLAPGDRGLAGSVARADLADFLLDQATSEEHLRQTITVAGW